MAYLDDLIDSVYEVAQKLKTERYILADTRIPNVSLFDHVCLTTAIATSMTTELLVRGHTPQHISGKDISVDDLKNVVKVSSLLHDWGKHHPSAYKGHVDRSVAWTTELLERENIEDPFKSLIISAIRRHHIENEPRTLLEKIVCLADSYASAADRPELAKAETPEQLVKLSSSALALEGSLFGSKAGVSLLLGDVDKIKAYVFETTRLPEIRGGSEILNELNKEELESLFKQKGLGVENLIYNGGGSFLAVIPSSLADDLSDSIKELYLRKTTSVTITIVTSQPLGLLDFGRGLNPYAIKGEHGLMAIAGRGIGEWLLFSHFGKEKGAWQQRKGFGELVASLTQELRLEKSAKTYVPFFETLPIARRCQSCGTKGAVGYDELRREYLCLICETKRRKGREARRRFLEEFEEWVNEKHKLNCKFKIRPDFDLDKLSEQYNGYVAFIYADGNDIGNLLYGARTPAAYRHISETLMVETKNALFEGLFQAVGKKRLQSSMYPPFEIINIGGDDVIVITAGPLAWKFSIEFLRAFENGLRQLKEELELDRPITSSLGFVIAKSTYPVYFMAKLAESLLRSAKRVAKETEPPTSALSYLYLITPVAVENSEDLIKEYYKKRDVNLTMRPYSLNKAETIWKLSSALKNIISISQAHAWEQSLQRGPLFAANYLLYQRGRMRVNKREELSNLMHDMSQVFKLTMYNKLFGLDSIGQVSTPLMDILEVIKFSGGELDGGS